MIEICDACGGTGDAPMPPHWHHPWPPACRECGGHGELEPALGSVGRQQADTYPLLLDVNTNTPE